MSQDITTVAASAIRTFSAEDIELLKSTVFPDSTDGELKLFVNICKSTGLNPFARQIYPMVQQSEWNGVTKRRMTTITSIDGFRLIAERSGTYQGQTKTLWCGKDKKWTDVWLEQGPPSAAMVGVWKAGCKEPIFAVAVFMSYAQYNKSGKLNKTWAQMPEVMIAKCAEALALRKAFPQELSGLYTQDEMDQAESVDSDSGRASGGDKGPKGIVKDGVAGQADNVGPQPEVSLEMRNRLSQLALQRGWTYQELAAFQSSKYNLNTSALLTKEQYADFWQTVETQTYFEASGAAAWLSGQHDDTPFGN